MRTPEPDSRPPAVSHIAAIAEAARTAIPADPS